MYGEVTKYTRIRTFKEMAEGTDPEAARNYLMQDILGATDKKGDMDSLQDAFLNVVNDIANGYSGFLQYPQAMDTMLGRIRSEKVREVLISAQPLVGLEIA